jgi:cytochrome P450
MFLLFLILGLSRTEMTQEMLSFLTASYGTVSTALAWFIHLMSKHSQVQLKIKRELAEHHIQSVSAEQLDLLVYLDCVLRELFRFAPPLHSSLRTLTVDDKLPASGVYLKKGEQLFIAIYNHG